MDAAACTDAVTIVDTAPPTITLNGEAQVTLQCSQSTYIEQGASVTDTCDTNLSQAAIGGDVVDVTVPATYVVTYDATDTSGNPAVQVTRTVNVTDATPPAVEVAPMIQLWPPEHQYRSLTLQDCVITVTDVCDGGLEVLQAGAIVSIYSDEPEDAQGGGDGSTLEDIVIESATSFKVRSERKGGANGRVYGVNFRVVDEAGNATIATCLVGVPHDQAGDPPVNDGAAAGYVVP
jgi:hypothetical protein